MLPVPARSGGPAVVSAQELYYPAAGGAEQSIHALLRGLNDRGYRCTALTRADRGRPAAEIIDGVQVRRCDPIGLETMLTDQITALRPVVALTQQAWSGRVVEVCHALGVPSICFARNTADVASGAVSGRRSATAVVASSPYLAGVIRARCGLDPTVIAPPIDIGRYRVRPAGDLITMINPVKVKGGAVFRDIARALPSRRFLAVKGWDSLRSQDGAGWDLRTLAASGVGLPVSIDLSGLANVDQLEPVTDMRAIYARTRILLVPSLWDEAFGRVAAEAMCSGIPVIASARGNLPDTVGTGGIIITDPLDIASWTTAVAILDNPAAYHHFSRQARRSARRYRIGAITTGLIRLLDQISDGVTVG